MSGIRVFLRETCGHHFEGREKKDTMISAKVNVGILLVALGLGAIFAGLLLIPGPARPVPNQPPFQLNEIVFDAGLAILALGVLLLVWAAVGTVRRRVTG